MELTELKDLLKRAIALEKNKFALGRILSEIDVTYKPTVEKPPVGYVESNPFPAPVAGPILAIVGIIIGYRYSMENLTKENMGFAFLIMGVLAVVCGSIPFIISVLKTKREEALWEKNAEKIRAETEKKNLENAAVAVKKNAITSYAVAKVNEAILTTKLELSKLYSLEFVHPKYRDLVSLSSIYEYLDTGRCDKLEGVDGAYNMYETEKRLDRIITAQDEIIDNLEAIKQSQYYLYSAITHTFPYIENVSAKVINKTLELDSDGALLAIEDYTKKILEDNRQYVLPEKEE